MAETKFPYLAKFLKTTQGNQDLPEEVLSGEFGEIFQRKEMLSVSPDAPCPEYQSKSILEVGDKTDKTSGNEVLSVLSGDLVDVSEENCREVSQTRKNKKSISPQETYTCRDDKTDKTLTVRSKQPLGYPCCPSCGCLVFVDGLCWGCSKPEINRRYPHLKPLAQIQQTLWNSDSFYAGKAHWRDLAREYREDHGEDISRDSVLMYAQALGHKVAGNHVCWANRQDTTAKGDYCNER